MRIERKATVNEMLALAASDEIAIFCDAKNKLYFWVQDGGALVIDNDNVYATRSGGNTRWSAIGSSSGGAGSAQYVASAYTGDGDQDSINVGSDSLAVVGLANAAPLTIKGISRTAPADVGKELILIGGSIHPVTIKFFGSATPNHNIITPSLRDIVLKLGDAVRLLYVPSGANYYCVVTALHVRGEDQRNGIAVSNEVNCVVSNSGGQSLPKVSNFGDLVYHADVAVTAPGLVTFDVSLPDNLLGTYSNNDEAGGTGAANDGAEVVPVHIEGINGTPNARVTFYAANAANYVLKSRIGYTVTG